MIRSSPEIDPADRDERLGEAIEAYITLAEAGDAPAPDAFAARYPELGDDLKEALEGLAMVRGLVGDPHEDSGHRLEAGRHVAGYRVVGELGRGGMGVVYEAVHVALGRPVALKVLSAYATPDSTGRRRFLNEARTAAGLHHTHIVPVFDVGQVGGLCYYAMQRIEGSGLDRVLRVLRADRPTSAGSGTGRSKGPARRPIPEPGDAETGTWIGGGPRLGDAPRRDATLAQPAFAPPRGSAYYRWVAQVGHDAADALDHAHGRGIIHRDIKPSNLLVDGRGSVWVADFGLARRLEDPALTRSDSLLGTPRYMSPEQAESQPVDGRTDVYSLGATLYELLTLRPPFEGQTTAELIRQIVGREPAPLRRSDPRIPRDLETIVLKALGKRPGDRYATAGELAEDLGRFLAMEPVRARRISPIGRFWRLARRNPVASSVSAAAAVIVLAVASFAHLGALRALQDVTRARDDADAALTKAEAAREQMKTARDETEAANVAMKDALRHQYLSEASSLRLSTVPRRRKTGLDLLGKAARLGPDAALRTRLRDEAIEFLAVRDVEPRPAIEAGKVQAVAFGPGGDRLATLSDDGTELGFWDPARGVRTAAHALGPPTAEPARRNDPRTSDARRLGGRLVAAGPWVAAVPPDGSRVLFFDARTGAPRGEPIAPGRGAQVLALYASADGGRLATLERAGPRRGFLVRLWDPEKPAAPIATLPPWEEREGPMRGGPLVALDPDGERLATARLLDSNPNPTIALWSARDGSALGAIKLASEADATSRVSALALGPAGLLAASSGGMVRLWDVRPLTAATPATPLPGLGPHQGGVQHLRFGPDGTTLAVATRDAVIELWNTAGAALMATLRATDRIDGLAFSPAAADPTHGRNSTLAVADQAPAVATWALIEPIGLARLPDDLPPATALAFGAGDVLAVATPNELHFWWPGACVATLPTWRLARPASLGPDRGTGTGPPSGVALAFDDRGDLLVLDADGPARFPAPGRRPAAEPPGAPVPALRLPLPPILPDPGRHGRGHPPVNPFPFLALAHPAAGRALALTRLDEVWIGPADLSAPPRRVTPPPEVDPLDQAAFWGLSGHVAPWRQVALAPAADRLYLINREEGFRAWSLDGEARARDLEWAVPRGVTALALSRDGRTLALGDHSGVVTLRDAATGAVRHRLTPPEGDNPDRIWSLAFSPRGDELAVGTREHARLWRLAPAPEPLLRLPGQHGRVGLLAYDAAGRHLAAGGEGRPVAIWDLDLVRRELAQRGLGW